MAKDASELPNASAAGAPSRKLQGTSCSVLWPPCSERPSVEPQIPLPQPASQRARSGPTETKCNACGAGAHSTQHAIELLDAEMRARFSDLDRKLELVALQVCGSLDSLSISLPRYPAINRLRSRSSTYSSAMNDLPLRMERPPGARRSSNTSTIQSVDERAAAPPAAPREGAAAADEGACQWPQASDELHRSVRPKLRRLGTGDSRIMAILSTGTGLFDIRRQGQRAQKIWDFFEDPDSSYGARWYFRLSIPFILASVLLCFIRTVEEPPLGEYTVLAIEFVYDLFFLAEVVLRYFACPSTGIFVSNGHNIVDLLAVLPATVHVPCLIGSLDCTEGTPAFAAMVCFAPVVRLMKTLRHYSQFHLFLNLLRDTREALSVLLFVLCIIVLTFSSLVYLVEPRENVGSLPEAMYLIIVTISTVGYGDITPESTTGTFAVCIIIVCSVLYMAMPMGIIGNAFSQIWMDRDRILLMIRTRERLTQLGYTAADMQKIFQHFDMNGNGELNLAEFRVMIDEMRIGIHDERIIQLFESFDRDGSGGIDVKEFTRTFFPSAYHEVVEQEAKASATARKPSRKLPRLSGRKRSKDGTDRTSSNEESFWPSAVRAGRRWSMDACGMYSRPAQGLGHAPQDVADVPAGFQRPLEATGNKACPQGGLSAETHSGSWGALANSASQGDVEHAAEGCEAPTCPSKWRAAAFHRGRGQSDSSHPSDSGQQA